jgi:hypothetical protein
MRTTGPQPLTIGKSPIEKFRYDHFTANIFIYRTWAALAGFEGDHLAYGLDSIEAIMSTVDLLTGEFANEYG